MVKIRWDTHRWDTEFAFENLKDYFEIVEGQFDVVRELEKKKIPQEPPPGLSEEEFVDWQSEIQFFEDRYERDFPSKIRYSFLVLLHIVVETRLRATCNEIAKRRNLELKEKELKGAAIERVKVFLDKVAKTPVKNQEIWQWLKDFQKVRDCIVHVNGRIELSRDKKRLNELCNKDLGLSIDAGTLIIKQEYCTKTLKIARNFFDQLFIATGFGSSIPVVE